MSARGLSGSFSNCTLINFSQVDEFLLWGDQSYLDFDQKTYSKEKKKPSISDIENRLRKYNFATFS